MIIKIIAADTGWTEPNSTLLEGRGRRKTIREKGLRIQSKR